VAVRRPTYVVVAGGDPIDAAALDDVPPGAPVIAADSGADHAVALGLHVDLLVGDLDSVSDAARLALEAAGVAIERHRPDKDQTDLDLALAAAVDRGAAEIVVLGGHGGRVDHYFANGLLLASPAFADVDLRARFGPARLWVVRRPTTLTGRPGELVTLLAVHGPATGIHTTGLAYPLVGEDLLPGSSRGVSNVFTAPEATIRLEGGVLLAIAPGA
jgi:thiamine pyrophosphokinase